MRIRKTSRTCDVDKLMLNVASTLVRDFREVSNDPLFCSDLLKAVREGDLKGIRGYKSADSEPDDPWLFKARYQMESLFKRYRFRKDIYSDDQLEAEAVLKFLQVQDRISKLDFDHLSRRENMILDRAEMYVARVLGPYSDEEHRALCRFGRKASVGVPARKACEAARWQIPISGSPEQISWFHSEMDGIACVKEYLTKQLDSDPKGSIYHETSSLRLTLVPKTFKSLRTIMPNTTIGSYISYGLGEMIRKRLKRAGYDIRRLQMKHREIAQLASIHTKYVTADLSSASDSISEMLVQRLLPPDWFEIMNQTRIGRVELPHGLIVDSLTFAGMGIGFTFPLQTLIFLSLLYAIQEVEFPFKEWRRISVYGDDLIYHQQIHARVLDLFPKLGFVINVDKTFATGNFRESCGGDYYHGVDVRPFQPRNGMSSVGHRAYEAVLYKYVNGLLARWSEYEVANTLDYLCQEIEFVAGAIKLVPEDYPDDSGVKCSTLLNLPDFLKRSIVARPKHLGHGVFRFSYLRFLPQEREENRHEPFLWLALRPKSPYTSYEGNFRPADFKFRRLLDRRLGYEAGEARLLLWRRTAATVRSCITGQRYRRLESRVVVSHTGSYSRQSGLSCFESRR